MTGMTRPIAWIRWRLAVLALGSGLIASPAWAVKTVTWSKTPVAITLIVGVEQMVHLQGPATVGLPPALAQGDVFRHLFASDTAYWKAMRPFDKQRIKVRLNESGDMVLFDVRAVTRKRPPKSVEPIALVMSKAATETNDESASASPNPLRRNDAPAPVTIFDVLRFAVQSDYSPQRVVSAVRGMREVKNTVRGDISALYAHGDAANLDMTVHRVWASGRYYVTALLVRNRTTHEITIDPSRLQHTTQVRANGLSNQFLAAATLRHVLGPRGATGATLRPDATRLYVVTDKPFATVIQHAGKR